MAERRDLRAAELFGQAFDLGNAFFAAVRQLGIETIGVEQRQIARRKRHERFGKSGIRLRADGYVVVDGQSLRLLLTVQLNDRQMARVDVAHLLAFPSSQHTGEWAIAMVFLVE